VSNAALPPAFLSIFGMKPGTSAKWLYSVVFYLLQHPLGLKVHAVAEGIEQFQVYQVTTSSYQPSYSVVLSDCMPLLIN